MSAIFCTECGKKNDSSAKFCFNCGENMHSKIVNDVAPASPSSNVVVEPVVADSNHDTKYKGIGGWLAYFVFGLFVTSGFAFFNAYSYLTSFNGYGDYSGAIVALGTGFAILGVAELSAIYLMFKSKRLAKSIVIAILVGNVIAYSADAMIVQAMYDAASTPAPDDLYSNVVRAIGVGGLWLLYFMRSKRVAATFTESGY